MAHLAQVSIRHDPFNVTAERIRALGQTTDAIAFKAAKAIYDGNVNIEVSLDEGSLLIKITVIGSLLIGTYHAVAIYPDFKEGVVMLCDDAQKYGVVFYDNILKAIGASQNQVVKVSKSLQTPGKIVRLLKKIERIDQSAPNSSTEEIQIQLAAARRG